MTIKDDFSLSKLFITKQINITVEQQTFVLQIPTLKNFFEDNDFNAIYHIWTMRLKDTPSLFMITLESSFEIITQILFNLGQYNKYRHIYNLFIKYLSQILPDLVINFAKKELKINNLIITTEIWDYILYILKLSCGEKVTQPLTFNSEEDRKLWMAQQEAEEKIKSLKAQKESDKDGLIKVFLAITYSFPSFTFDYLYNQTMAQIHWLQTMAAGAVSYEVNAQAMAAGNMKKGKKLDFFIK